MTSLRHYRVGFDALDSAYDARREGGDVQFEHGGVRHFTYPDQVEWLGREILNEPDDPSNSLRARYGVYSPRDIIEKWVEVADTGELDPDAHEGRDMGHNPRLPPAPPKRRFGQPPPAPTRRRGTLDRVRRLGEQYEERERPFDPERPGDWKGGRQDLVLNGRGDWAYAASGERVFVPDVKVTVERTGYELVPLRGYGHALAVRDVNGKLVGWMPIEVTGCSTVKEWMEEERFVANAKGRLTKEDEKALREYARQAWSTGAEDEGGEIRLEDTRLFGDDERVLGSLAELQDELVRIANEDDVDDALKKFNFFFDGFGVEALGPVDMHDGPPFLYVNQGDTYNQTIVYSRDEDRFMVTDWGSVWEEGGEQSVLEDAWADHIRDTFHKQVMLEFEAEVDDDTGRTAQGYTAEELDELVTFAEDALEDGGLAFFQKALWEAQQSASIRQHPEVSITDTEVYVHHMDPVARKAVEMILAAWKKNDKQLELAFNGQPLDPSGVPTPTEFEAGVRRLLDIGDRQIHFSGGNLRGDLARQAESLFVTYVNLPEGVGGAGGGAEAQNNRTTLVVYWPRRQGIYRDDVPIPEGRLRVETLTTVLPRPSRLRSKTTTPDKAARYIADFLNRVAREVPPRFTHTTR